MPYKVAQYDSHTDRLHQAKTYRFKIVAMIIAWTVSGKGFNGQEFYSTVTYVKE